MTAKFVEIETLEQLDEMFEQSNFDPVVILKHSNTCGISMDILEQIGTIEGTVNLIVIQENRPLSAAMATKTGHRHQSPQAFVIKGGKPIYHATHYGIDPAEIQNKLRK